jgi:hypothetical protein
MQQPGSVSCSIRSALSTVSAVAVVASAAAAAIVLATPPTWAQSTYERYLEPPAGFVLQGIGQWPEENEDYLEVLAGYPTPPFPGHEMVIVNIAPSENAADRPFDAEAAATVLARMEAMAEEGRIPALAVSFNDYTPSGPSGFSKWTAHDDEVTDDTGTTNTAMEDQIERLGEMLVDFELPVFMRIGFEFNNATIATESEGYHAYAFPICYRRTVEILEAEGATRIAYVWCWQASAPTDYMALHPTTSEPKWYPGDAYVDWFGVDIFNRNEFTTLSSPITASASKLANVEAFLAVAESKDYPVFIGESSCVDFSIDAEECETNESWEEWFVHYFDFIAEHPSIKAINYISHDWTGGSGGPSIWLDGTLINCEAVMDEWVAAISEPEFLGADSEALLNGYHGWWGLGNDLAGTNGRPHLSGAGTVLPDAHVGLVLVDAAPNADAYLLIGLSAGYSAYMGGVLVPNVSVVFDELVTSGAGAITIPFTWPDTASPGYSVWFQYWIEDAGGPQGYAASNAIKGVTL